MTLPFLPVRLNLAAMLLVLVCPALSPGVSAQTRFAEETLWREGKAAYDRLPKAVLPRNANDYVTALKFLLAYEVRGPAALRNDAAHARRIESMLFWLGGQLGRFGGAGGSGDDLTSRLDRILDEADSNYEELPRDLREVTARETRAFIIALVDYFSYVQHPDSRPSVRVRERLQRLESNLAVLARLRGGVSGDDLNDVGTLWLPVGPKPSSDQEQVRRRVLPSEIDGTLPGPGPAQGNEQTTVVAPEDRPARLIVSSDPIYPRRLLHRRIEGWVLLEYSVAPTGMVESIEILDSEPANAFVRAAIQTLQTYRFEPAIRNGQAVRAGPFRARMLFKPPDD